MMRLTMALVFGCVASAAGLAQDSAPPQRPAGFLQPGMHVGIVASDDSDEIKVTIYSDADFELALDARRMDLESLAAKHERVAAARDRALKQFEDSLDAKRIALPPGAELVDPKVSLRIDRRESLYTIDHVGDDYILVSPGGDQSKRRVFATRFISSIRWSESLEFTASVNHVGMMMGSEVPSPRKVPRSRDEL